MWSRLYGLLARLARLKCAGEGGKGGKGGKDGRVLYKCESVRAYGRHKHAVLDDGMVLDGRVDGA